MPNSPDAFSTQGLTLSIGAANLVHGVDLSVGFGECIALMGPSGAGKSITAQAVSGILPEPFLQSGSVQRETAVAYLPQDAIASLDPLRTVRWHIEQCQPATGHRVETLLSTLNFSDAARVLDLYPHQLSGGMARRITFAQCLLSNHNALIVDEPTNGVDSSAAASIMRHIHEWVTQDRAALIITHNPIVATQWCSKILIMSDGRITERCTASEFERGAVSSDIAKRYHKAWSAFSQEACP